MKTFLSLTLLLGITLTGMTQNALNYQQPPAEILKLVDADPTPSSYSDEKGEVMILAYHDAFRSLEVVAAEELRLAGLRINPRNMGPSRVRYHKRLVVKNLRNGTEMEVTGLPEKLRASNVGWSPDQAYLTFTHSTENGMQLWILDVKTANAKCLVKEGVNDVISGLPYEWWPDASGMLVKLSSPEGELLDASTLPQGPVVQESGGRKAPARTYQDLLKSPADESNFNYFTRTRLVNVSLDGKQTEYAAPSILRSFSISPDGEYVLLKPMVPPYSYLVPYYRFPYENLVVDKQGKLVKAMVKSELQEVLPKGFDATQTGPRYYGWRSDADATLYWFEAQDGGDPAQETEVRDLLREVSAPFDGEARDLLKTKLRISGVTWGSDELAVVTERWWRSRATRTTVISPARPSKSKLLIDRSTEDYYGNPGNFLTHRHRGKLVLLIGKKGQLYLRGQGYSPEGNKPFIDELQPFSGTNKRLWQADGVSTYEQIVRVPDIEKGELITLIEGPDQQPNFYRRNFRKGKKPTAITDFPHPYASFQGVTKERLRYERADGVPLSGTLYLPAGYDKEKDGPLPVLLWAYPREYKNASKASQIKESPHRFIRLYYGSPIYWVARGYAVLDNADFPIIGEGDEEPNDSFIDQLVMNGAAAINVLEKMGVGDPNRVGVGGHSYGAFMTANLLAHSDLFAAGIARSGAYNRTLTPFGFQSEERTFWEAKDVYMTMSPFMHADKVNEPLLLIHGAADNNSGTYPMQSERFYNALKGHGATARLVMLPHESHGYSAKENIYHMLWEMDRWLETHVKNKGQESKGKP